MSAALADNIRRDHELAMLSAAIADFEREFGEITAQEIAAQARRERELATVVRGQRKSSRRRPRSA